MTVANAADKGSAININISDTLPTGFTFNSTGTVTLNGESDEDFNPRIPPWAIRFQTGAFLRFQEAAGVVLTFTASRIYGGQRHVSESSHGNLR